ncbi:MAG: hypothetical protein QM703_27215 [Gemmatales bacterium]
MRELLAQCQESKGSASRQDALKLEVLTQQQVSGLRVFQQQVEDYLFCGTGIFGVLPVDGMGAN